MLDNSQNSNNVNNLFIARECCLRGEDYLCGKTKSCAMCPYMKNVARLWENFCDIPVDWHRAGCITEEWNSFPIGTFRVNILDWFHNIFEVDIDALKKLTGRYSNKKSSEYQNKVKE